VEIFLDKNSRAWTQHGRTKVSDNSHNVVVDIEGDLFIIDTYRKLGKISGIDI
jgi:hypothetical protein